MKRRFNRSHGFRGAVLACSSTVLLAACGSFGSFMEGQKVDYRNTAKVPTLEVPPDLTQIPKDDRFSVPGGRAAVTATGLAQRDANRPATAGAGAVLPEFKTAKIERLGSQRWLVVAKAPEAVYPIARDFWGDVGLALKVDSPATGIMETDWSENRANIPKEGVRAIIGKVLDSVYDSGTRDKFRTRIERRTDGGSDIYITHRGMIETVTDRFNTTTRWEPRPSDPELEAEFTRRLLVRLGYDETAAKDVVASGAAPAASGGTAPASTAARARLVQAGGASLVEVDDNFEQAWRRVGLALDRVGFTVEDRDRAQGLYFVRYVDPNADGKKEEGFFSKLFSSSNKAQAAAQYRVSVKTEGEKSRVAVQAADGSVANGDTASKILALLADDLK